MIYLMCTDCSAELHTWQLKQKSYLTAQIIQYNRNNTFLCISISESIRQEHYAGSSMA